METQAAYKPRRYLDVSGKSSNKPFAKLRSLMRYYEVTQEELGYDIHKSKVYINERMSGKKPWTLEDIYKIIELFHLTPDDIPKYFPNGG